MVCDHLSWFRDLVTFGDTPEGLSIKKRQAHHKMVRKRVGEGQSQHILTKSSSPNRKKSPVEITRCLEGIEEHREEISSIRRGVREQDVFVEKIKSLRFLD